MTSPAQFSFGVVILAAGASTRMGRPKLLLAWNDTTVISHLAATWASLGAAQTVAVASLDNLQLLQAAAPGLEWIVNSDPKRGMFSSIVAAADWTAWHPDLTHWVITLGDQPHLLISTLEQLLTCARDHPHQICQPSFRGQRKHPVILPRRFFKLLPGANAVTLKDFLQGHPADIKTAEATDCGLDLDMDTLEDYARALQLGAAGTHPQSLTNAAPNRQCSS